LSSDNHSQDNKGLPLSINFSVLALTLVSFSFVPMAFTSEKFSSQSWVPKATYVQFGENYTKLIHPFEFIDKSVSPNVETVPNGPSVEFLSYSS